MEIKMMHGENLTIALVGRLDTVTSVELNDAFTKEEVKENLVVFDFQELQYISSAGLRVLLAIKKSLEDEGKELEIINLNNVVREVFKVTGFINVLTVK